jgi:hypothetical protein
MELLGGAELSGAPELVWKKQYDQEKRKSQIWLLTLQSLFVHSCRRESLCTCLFAIEFGFSACSHYSIFLHCSPAYTVPGDF